MVAGTGNQDHTRGNGEVFYAVLRAETVSRYLYPRFKLIVNDKRGHVPFGTHDLFS